MKCPQCSNTGLVQVDGVAPRSQGRRVVYAVACNCQNGGQFRGTVHECEGKRHTFDTPVDQDRFYADA